MPKLALCYIRKSYVRRDVPDPAGPPQQRTSTTARAAELGLTPQFYEDAEGHHSGLTDDRPGWQELLTHLADPGVGAVIVHDWEKAFRNVRLMLEFIDSLPTGVRFIATNDNIDTRSADGRFHLTILASVAEHYARKTSERRIASINELRRERGRHYGLAPFGTTRVEENRERVLKPSTLEQSNGTDHDALIQCYEIYNTGASLRATYLQLNAAGWQYRDRYKKLRPWTVDDVRRVIASHWIYAGYVTLGRAYRNIGEILPGSHAPILPANLTDAVTIRMKKYIGRRGHDRRDPLDYPLSRLLYCQCGERLKGGSDQKTRYYRHTAPCASNYRVTHNSEKLEQIVRAHVANLTPPDSIRRVAARTIERAFVTEHNHPNPNAETERLNQSLERLTSLFVDDLIDRANYEQRRAALIAQINAIAPAANSSGLSPIAGLPDLEISLTCSLAHLREILTALYKQITIAPDGNLTYTPNEWCTDWA